MTGNPPPRIGVTSRLHRPTNSFRVPQAYIWAIMRAGGTPFIIPFGPVDTCAALLANVDGLMLTGGEDIDPTFASGSVRLDGYEYCPERDAFEIELARHALAARKTVLGICRGCQALYVATGHRLISDIPGMIGDRIVHRVSIKEPSRHGIVAAQEGRVSRAYGRTSFSVTSYHHQGLHAQSSSLPPWLATAWSDDGLVEAIEHESAPWIVGVLWHPETSDDGGPNDDPLIADFIAAARASNV